MKFIKLTNGQKSIVDDEDYNTLNLYKWGNIGKKTIYAARGRRIKGKYYKILMHREIMNANNSDIVDHINGNTLDNRKINLRFTDRTGNCRNCVRYSNGKNKYKGVRQQYSSSSGIRYSARIQINKKTRLYLGYFKNEEDAVLAYNNAAIKFFGEFAKLNKIEKDE